MIDLHFHCLPGIDDGPSDWTESVALCRAAADEGITDIVATPHVLRDPWLNESQALRASLVAQLNDRLGGSPRVWPGCEYYFSLDALELWELGTNGPLSGLNRGSHLLLEFPSHELPRSARGVLHELGVAGVTPVIAHPERHRVLARDFVALQELIELGACVQITAASLLGDFGAATQSAAEEMIDRGLAHVVASDAHSLSKRPPLLARARRHVCSKWGEEAATVLFDRNAAKFAALQPLRMP